MHVTRAALLILFPLAVAGLVGCRTQPAQVLGRPPATGAVTDIGRLAASAKPVTVRGTMIEKCPISGCWFKVRDASGVLKVTTANAGFVVVNVPNGAELTVTGTVQTQPERELVATGLSY